MSSSTAGHAGHDHHHDDGAVHAHIAPVMFYVGIFGALIFLTFVTVGVSYFDFGSANTIIALVVATMKASLVAAFFMHLTHDKLFNTICLLAAFLFLGVFFILTYEDQSHRAMIDDANGSSMYLAKGQVAPGGISISAPPSEPKSEGKGGHHGAEPAGHEKGGAEPHH